MKKMPRSVAIAYELAELGGFDFDRVQRITVDADGRISAVMSADATDAAFQCIDCDVNVSDIDEYYMLRNEVWLEANPWRVGMLCIGCVEERTGRLLVRADFSDAPLNHDLEWPQSERLINRLAQ